MGKGTGKVVLAYSGGLDTSVAIRWINEKYNLDVIAVTVDVGNEKDFEVVRQKALRTGAIQAFIADVKDQFVGEFVFPSLQAGTLYQNVYPLATALARPLISKVLDDPWNEPPEEAYAWTINPRFAPEEPTYVTIEFERGVPVALGDDPETTQRLDGVTLVSRLNELGGAHGVGRIDHVEDRLVGIKSREVYEAPAAIVLHAAHSALETLTLSREQRR